MGTVTDADGQFAIAVPNENSVLVISSIGFMKKEITVGNQSTKMCIRDSPNDFQYPGGPPVRPYDAAGWTLAYQMGVEFDRILIELDGPFQALPYGESQHPRGTLAAMNPTAGSPLSPLIWR